MTDRIYVTVPELYDDLAITKQQHDRMVGHLKRPLTWPIDHRKHMTSIDPMSYLTTVLLRHEGTCR